MGNFYANDIKIEEFQKTVQSSRADLSELRGRISEVKEMLKDQKGLGLGTVKMHIGTLSTTTSKYAQKLDADRKFFQSITRNIQETEKTNERLLRELVGVTDTMPKEEESTPSQSSPFPSWFQNFWNKYGDTIEKVGNVTLTFLDKIGCKWAGAIKDLYKTAKESLLGNIDEFQGQKGAIGKIIDETVVETIADIGLGALVNIGLTAIGASVLIPVAAPVIVWGINEVCKWLTKGKDVKEVIADTVCGIKENIQKNAKHIKNGIEQAGKTIKRIGNGLGQVFTSWSKVVFS